MAVKDFAILKRTAQGQYRTSNWEAAYLVAGCVFAAIGLMSAVLAIAARWYLAQSPEDLLDPTRIPFTHYAAAGAFVLASVSFAFYFLSRRNRRHVV